MLRLRCLSFIVWAAVAVMDVAVFLVTLVSYHIVYCQLVSMFCGIQLY